MFITNESEIVIVSNNGHGKRRMFPPDRFNRWLFIPGHIFSISIFDFAIIRWATAPLF